MDSPHYDDGNNGGGANQGYRDDCRHFEMESSPEEDRRSMETYHSMNNFGTDSDDHIDDIDINGMTNLDEQCDEAMNNSNGQYGGAGGSESEHHIGDNDGIKLQNEIQESETAVETQNVRENRINATRRVAGDLTEVLDRIKQTTKIMLNEIDTYMQATESVTVDYICCQASQRNEARRLEEVEPDVSGATARFMEQAQNQSLMAKK